MGSTSLYPDTFTWTSKSAHSIYARVWDANGPRAAICMVHGLGEHCGRYEHVASYFNGKGYAFMSCDLIGHGKSSGKRGHIRSIEDYFQNIRELLNHARRRFPGTPLILYGQSMGGNLVLNYALRERPEIKGLIASSSWIRLPVQPSAARLLLAKTMKRLFPSYTESNKLKTEHLSRDSRVVEAYEADPLVHDRISANTAVEMLKAADWLNLYRGPVYCPTLLMHGTNDRITSMEGSLRFAERVSGQVSWKPWEGFYHEIHNEMNKEEALEYVNQWIKTILAP